jgi:hypothetical protein
MSENGFGAIPFFISRSASPELLKQRLENWPDEFSIMSWADFLWRRLASKRPIHFGSAAGFHGRFRPAIKFANWRKIKD